MTMYTTTYHSTKTNYTNHMKVTTKRALSYSAKMLGVIPSTYNTVTIPRPTVWYDEGDAQALVLRAVKA